MQLARISTDRRFGDRRQASVEETITTYHVFDSEERSGFKELERRRSLRRATDLRRSLVRLER